MTLPDDDSFLDEIFELAVQRHAQGRPLGVAEVVLGREHLRERIQALLSVARDVAPTSSAGLPGDPFPVVAGFTILREAGRGGMGIVYHARQHSLDRAVALKILAPTLMASPQARERFLHEARALARVSHPNVVQVHEVVSEPAVSAYAMEWVDGTTLSRAVARGERRFDVRAIAHLGVAVARALEAVHTAGLVHRDVKPGNVLLHTDGRVLLADFGLASDADEDSRCGEGEFAGTTQYAAPEQLRGEQAKVGPWTDVYSLGATLFHVIRAKPPGATRSGEVPHDLEAVLTKAMARDPGARYATAAAFGDDLERFLRFEPVHARPVNARLRFARWVRRHPQLALALAALVTSLVTGLTISVKLQLRAVAERVEAERREYSACIAAAEAAWRAQDGTDSQAQLERAPAAFRHWEWSYMKARAERSRVVGHHDGRIRSMAACPVGPTMATSSHDASVCIWDVDERTLVRSLAHEAPVWGLAWRNDGAFLACATETTLHVWDAKTWTQHARYRLRAPGRALAFAPDDRHLAVGLVDGKIAIYASSDLIGSPRAQADGIGDLPAAQRELSIGAAVHELRFSPRGWLAATSSPGVLVWDLASGRELRRFSLGANTYGLAVHPDGNRLAAGANNGRIGIFEVEGGRELERIPAHEGRVTSLAWIGSNDRLLSASLDRTLRVWGPSGTAVDVLVGHLSGLAGVAVLRDGRVVSAGSARDSSEIRVWESRGRATMLRSGHGYHSVRVLLDPLGAWFAWTTSTNSRSYVAIGSMEAPNLEGGTLLNLPTPMALPLAVSADGARLAVGTRDGIRVYSREAVMALAGAPGTSSPDPLTTIAALDVQALAFGASPSLLAVGDASGAVVVRDLERGGIACTTTLDGGAVTGIDRDPRRHHFLAATAKQAILFDARSGARLRVWSELRQCGGVAFSPDGELVALAHRLEQPVITVWSRSSETVHHELRGHNGRIFDLAFSPDGLRLASGSEDQTVRLWDPRSGMAAATLHDHAYLVRCVEWSRDGTQLVSSGADGVVWFRPAHFQLPARH